MNPKIWSDLPRGIRMKFLRVSATKALTEEGRAIAKREYRQAFYRGRLGDRYLENMRRMLDDEPAMPLKATEVA